MGSHFGVGEDITTFERTYDVIVGLGFLALALVAAKRMNGSRDVGGSETTVVTAFYSLILITASLRAIWFLIPNSVWQPTYTPTAVMAFDTTTPWWGTFASEAMLTAGSLALFAIFILILVYWADILKKYFYPGARRSRPMMTFAILIATLISLEFLNALFFLLRAYSSEGMILFNAILLSSVSLICVVEITIFSHRFRTVLKTLGAINQVSTESQVQRIVWITVTGNVFFFTRALLEMLFAILLISYWSHYGSVQRVFSHSLWDVYVYVKHTSEVAILCLMLYILQSRFTTNAAAGYQSVPDAETSASTAPATSNAPSISAIVV
jgi:hypothetical protein